MKAQQEITTYSMHQSQPKLEHNEITLEMPKKLFGQIKCISQRDSDLACLNKHCVKYAFLCQNQQCSCNVEHKGCLIVKTSSIINSLNNKVIQTQQLQDFVDNSIQRLIDYLSDFKDKLIQQINLKFQFFGLNQNEKEFLRLMQSGNVSTVTGKQLWLAHLDFQKQANTQQQMRKSIERSKKMIAFLEDQLKKKCSLFNKQMQSLQELGSMCIQTKQKIIQKNVSLVRNDSFLEYTHFKQSKIVTAYSEALSILQFFFPSKISNAKLLYSASQSNFSVEKFHQKCDNVYSTLVICETEYDKKIGGFTPIPWGKAEKAGYKKDTDSKSFLFSLTNNDKFTLSKPQNAVYHNSDNSYGPDFGDGTDLRISDKANEVMKSLGNVNHSYKNFSYKIATKDTYKNFGGNPNDSSYFKLKEWEVWKIEF